jgi:hypothetical protein
VVARNQAALIQVLPPAHEQAWVSAASFVPTSGKPTEGLDRFWTGRPRRTDQGLALSALAWLASTDHCAYGLSAEPTPPAAKTTDPAATRLAVDLEQLARVVSAPHLRPRRDVITAG